MVPLSRTNTICWKCSKPTQAIFCESCGALGAVTEGIHYFAVFGLVPSLLLEESPLRESFYQLSKKLHPDRFAQSGNTQEAIYSTQWSALLNRAYQTLKDPVKRSTYLLELFEVPPTKPTQIPFDLAETYFEIQEALEESEGSDRLKQFLDELEIMVAHQDKEWLEIAKRWDELKTSPPLAKENTLPLKILVELQEHLQKRRYLASMKNDIERKREGTNLS